MPDYFALIVTSGICTGTLLMVIIFFIVIFWQENREFKEHPVAFPKKPNHPNPHSTVTPSSKSVADDDTSVTASTLTLEMSTPDDFGSRAAIGEEGQGQGGDVQRLRGLIGYDNPSMIDPSQSEWSDFTKV